MAIAHLWPDVAVAAELAQLRRERDELRQRVARTEARLAPRNAVHLATAQDLMWLANQ